MINITLIEIRLRNGKLKKHNTKTNIKKKKTIKKKSSTLNIKKEKNSQESRERVLTVFVGKIWIE